MQTETKMVRRRKALTPVEHFKSIHCSPSDFQKKTGHRYAILVSPKDDKCMTVDMENARGVLEEIEELSFASWTTPRELSMCEPETCENAVYQAILYGFCVNMSGYPVAIFCGNGQNLREVTLFVPCFWE